MGKHNLDWLGSYQTGLPSITAKVVPLLPPELKTPLIWPKKLDQLLVRAQVFATIQYYLVY